MPDSGAQLFGTLGAGSIHDLYPRAELANEIQRWAIRQHPQPVRQRSAQSRTQAGLYQTDLSVNKKFNTPLESLKIEFRTEIYNLFNHTNLYLPGTISGAQAQRNTTASTGAILPLSEINGGAPTGGGQITSTWQPRIFQFGLKVIY